MKKERCYLLYIGIFYLVFLTLFISKFNFNPSATVEFSHTYLNRTPLSIPHGIVIHETDGFDGQYYYALTTNHSLHNLNELKMGSNFTQRLVYPSLVYILSFGFPVLFPIMFIVINMAAILISSFFVIRLLQKYNTDIRYVFIWTLSVGLLVSISRNLTEPLMMLCIAGAVYYTERNQHILSASLLALSLLTRELALTVWMGYLLFYILRRQWRKVLYIVLALIPFILWEYILYLYTGAVPLFKSSQALASPVTTAAGYSGHIFAEIWHALNPLHKQIGQYLQELNRLLSPIPLLLSALIWGCILIRDTYRERSVTFYGVLLASQLALLGCLQQDLLLYGEVDAIGRYSLGMVFFSLLYVVERKKKYPKFILWLMIISTALYFIQRALIAKGAFFIT